jgi:hypothetical protein
MKSYLRFTNRLGLLVIFLCSWVVAQAERATEAWVQRYSSGEARSLDYGRKVVVDLNGNIVVAGDTDDRITGADIVVIKYSGAGVALWTNRYNGPANGDDRGLSAGVDQSGNVFVTGSSAERDGGINYITLAYSPTGVRLWTNRYDGPANGEDAARALAVDHNGNVFVTGYSSSNGYPRAYATIAYSGAGVALWTNRYSDGFYNEANALTVDLSGNVLVTGSSAGNYATIAYSGGGIPLWTNRYLASGANSSATAIGVDNAGNVFVTGGSYGVGSFYDDHYSTIAYSPAGVPLWTNLYNGTNTSEEFATALAVDRFGNVFVTGYSYDYRASSNGVTAYITIAYSGAGVALWTNDYGRLSGFGSRPSAIAAGDDGKVFVTGSSGGSYATIAYSGAGEVLWTNRYGASVAYAIAVDRNGNVFVTGSDYATIAYSGAGRGLWTNRYDGPFNSSDEATAVTVDQRTGNVFVTGSSTSDYLTIAYSEAGVPLWTNRYNGPTNRADGARAIAVSRNGNVIVAGESASDYATVVYSASGFALWTNRYDGPGNSIDDARAVAVDDDGNVVVTGYSISSGSNSDYATIAYSGAGVPLWTNRYNGSGNNTDYALALAVDKTGNVYVTGWSDGADSYVDYGTLAYSRTGVPLWTNRYSGPSISFDRANAIAVDNRGQVFVTGWSYGSGGDLGYATIAYSQAGAALWTNRYDGGGGANAIAVDQNGNVFVTGSSAGPGGNSDYVTIAYSGGGFALWTNRYDGTGNSNDVANAVMVDNSGNVFVTGYSIGQGNNYDYTTIAYSASGVGLWTNRYNGPANGPDRPGPSLWISKCLAIGPNSEVYVTGGSDGHYGEASIFDYATIKYVWRPQLAIPPFVTGSSTVNLTLSGPQNSSWSIQRALALTGSWTNLGLSLLGTNGLGIFSDPNPPAQGGFYRAVQP